MDELPVKKVLWSEAVRSLIEQGQSHFLERSSMRALSASNAGDFVAQALAERPDLVVLPPGGLEQPAVWICQKLRGDDRTRGIPILAICRGAGDAEMLRASGCVDVVDQGLEPPQALQDRIARAAGMRLRRHRRYRVVVPVARGRFISDFLGYSTNLSEGGVGFDTLTRLRANAAVFLRLYQTGDERPIKVRSRIVSVRPNTETGVGFATGVEFQGLKDADHDRLVRMFPQDSTVIWGPDPPGSPVRAARR